MKIRYVGPFDAVEIPDAGSVAKKGQVFDIDLPDVAAGLLSQPKNFEPVDDEAQALVKRLNTAENDEPQGDLLEALTIDELKGVADDEGVDRTGLTKKDDLIAAIRLHRETEGA